MEQDDFNIEDEIDWAELQDFFFEDLRPKLFDMDQLCSDGDTHKLSRLGHSLKGSGGGVKLPRFTDLGKALEDAGKASNLEGCISACRAIRDEYATHRPAEQAELSALFAQTGRAAA
ncbi:MAG: Hpt domain-containing protein [Candidatus Eisenbacteria bacterium]